MGGGGFCLALMGGGAWALGQANGDDAIDEAEQSRHMTACMGDEQEREGERERVCVCVYKEIGGLQAPSHRIESCKHIESQTTVGIRS